MGVEVQVCRLLRPGEGDADTAGRRGRGERRQLDRGLQLALAARQVHQVGSVAASRDINFSAKQFSMMR